MTQQIFDVTDEFALTDGQQDAILALLTQSTITQAAKAAGVDRGTLYNWLRVPEFAACYRECRRLTFENALTKLQGNGSIAADVLAEIMQDTNVSPATRVAACDKTLSHAANLTSSNEVESLVAEYKERLKDGI